MCRNSMLPWPAYDLKCRHFSLAVPGPLLDRATRSFCSSFSAPSSRWSHQTCIPSISLVYLHPFWTWLSYSVLLHSRSLKSLPCYLVCHQHCWSLTFILPLSPSQLFCSEAMPLQSAHSSKTGDKILRNFPRLVVYLKALFNCQCLKPSI